MFWKSKYRKRIDELERQQRASDDLIESLWNSNNALCCDDGIRFEFSHGGVQVYSRGEALTNTISREDSERLQKAMSALHHGVIRTDTKEQP